MEPSGLSAVRQIADLARLHVSDEECASLARQFERTLEHFRVLERLDVAGVEPMQSASGAGDVLRADTPEPSFAADRMLANAPERIDDFYGVPKTIGGVA